jgi:hypothetical protein
VRQNAAEALRRIGWQPADDREKGLCLIARKDWHGCVMLGQPVVAALIAILRDEDEEVRVHAKETLDKIEKVISAESDEL